MSLIYCMVIPLYSLVKSIAGQNNPTVFNKSIKQTKHQVENDDHQSFKLEFYVIFQGIMKVWKPALGMILVKGMKSFSYLLIKTQTTFCNKILL